MGNCFIYGDFVPFPDKLERFMKKILFAGLFVIELSACSNKNNLAAQLLNEKRVVEDSIDLAHNYESYYKEQAKNYMHGGNDSAKWKDFADSSSFFYVKGRSLSERLRAINFSIDSLSRMK